MKHSRLSNKQIIEQYHKIQDQLDERREKRKKERELNPVEVLSYVFGSENVIVLDDEPKEKE